MNYLSICENAPNSQLGEAAPENSQVLEHSGEGTQLPELMFLVVGSDYRAGAKSDAQLADALGTKFAYSANLPAALNALSARFQHPWFAPTTDGQVSCVFEVDGVAAVTVSQRSEAHAAACALHFLIIHDKSALT